MAIILSHEQTELIYNNKYNVGRQQYAKNSEGPGARPSPALWLQPPLDPTLDLESVPEKFQALLGYPLDDKAKRHDAFVCTFPIHSNHADILGLLSVLHNWSLPSGIPRQLGSVSQGQLR